MRDEGIYVCIYQIYLYISGFLFQKSNLNNGGGEAPYIGNTKLLRQASKGQRGLKGRSRLIEEAWTAGRLLEEAKIRGQGFLKKP